MEQPKRRQNYAVRNQRTLGLGDEQRDDFPTPCWATRALLRHPRYSDAIRNSDVVEPACGRGYMAKPIREYLRFGRTLWKSDIAEYPQVFNDDKPRVADFLDETIKLPSYAWVITNPPFKAAEAFARRALDAGLCLALFVRTNWINGVAARYRLFQEYPPTAIMFFSQRVPLREGVCDPTFSTATDYCWVVWDGFVIKRILVEGDVFCRVSWFPPDTRQKFEYADDYPGYEPTGRRSAKTGLLEFRAVASKA